MEFNQNENLEFEFIRFNAIVIILDCDLLNAELIGLYLK